jgi:hypothetical protein
VRRDGPPARGEPRPAAPRNRGDRRARDGADREAREVRHVKEGLRRVELAEAERQRIFLGSRKGNPFADVDPACLAGVGRAWLREIGQLPDWDLILDRRGRAIGRHSAGADVGGVGDTDTLSRAG